ncbi:MAG: hypothetical protein ACK4WC_12945 [Rubrimonas sp.]
MSRTDPIPNGLLRAARARLRLPFPRDRRASVAVEAGLTLTLLAFAALAAFDGARYLKLMARADRVAGNLADIASRSDVLRDRPVFDAASLPNDTGTLFELSRLMLDAPGAGIIVSGVRGSGTGHAVAWTRAAPELDPGEARVAHVGALPAGAEFVVAEVIVPFVPVALDVSGLGIGGRIYSRAVFRTRHGGPAMLEAE